MKDWEAKSSLATLESNNSALVPHHASTMACAHPRAPPRSKRHNLCGLLSPLWGWARELAGKTADLGLLGGTVSINQSTLM